MSGVGNGKGEGAERLLQDYIEFVTILFKVWEPVSTSWVYVPRTYQELTQTWGQTDSVLFSFSFFYDETGLALQQHYEQQSRVCTTY